MPTTVTLGLRSGRPNPRFQLSPETEEKLLVRLSRLVHTDRRRIEDVRPFRVLVFSVTVDSGPRRAHFLVGGGLVEVPFQPFSYIDDTGVEKLLIDAIPSQDVPTRRKRQLIEMIPEAAHYLAFKKPPRRPRCRPRAFDAPPFDQNFGNTATYNHHGCNNCYDYANDQRTDTYSQPGLGSGQIYASVSCADITAAAIRDGLVPASNLQRHLKPSGGWYVALLLGTDGLGEPDYHWLRKDQTGCWSHKLNGGAPYAIDSNKTTITNPKNATFKYSGLMEYPTFCGYFITNSRVTIKGSSPTTNCWDWGW